MARSRPSRGKPPTHVIPPTIDPPRRPDRRRYIYAGLDVGLGAMQTVIAFSAPSRHSGGQALILAIAAAFVVAGVATAVGRPAGWRVAAAALLLLLVLEVGLLVGLVTSAAFLAGVFGSFGQAAASVALMAAALTIQTIALVPALQLKYLRTRGGRRAFGRPA
jgi:hypothetical protein